MARANGFTRPVPARQASILLFIGPSSIVTTVVSAQRHRTTKPFQLQSLQLLLSLQRRLVRIGRRLEQHPALTVSSIRPIDHNHHKITRWRQSTALDRRNESYCTTAAPADASGAGTRRLSIRVHGPPDAHNKYNPSILL